MLNIDDSILILPSLLFLILSVGGLDGLVSMEWYKSVNHPHVKECTLPLILPRAFTSTLCLPHLWFSVGYFLRIGVEGVVQHQHLGTLR